MYFEEIEESSMDFKGGFHEETNDGKLFFVYHNPKFHQIPQAQSLASSTIATSNDQPLFLCPRARWFRGYSNYGKYYPLNSSPEYDSSSTRSDDHHVDMIIRPCRFNECRGCSNSNLSTDYYFCKYCRDMFHKECVESPFTIDHPYHREHSLQLYYHDDDYECLCCGRTSKLMAYYCKICHVFMHPICAMKSIPFVIDQPKRHDHPLTFFPRQTSLTCNVCGLIRRNNPTYDCLRCNFVAHNDCMYSPRIIKISRHHHRISYMPSLTSGRRWSCGVCRQCVDSGYGAYTCEKCNDYVVHPRCALEKDVCNGEELESVKEEDDITQDLEPFDMISKGVILHFLHDHYLRLEIIISYDESKLCQACVLPIFEGNFYSCMECDFIFHETCTKLPRRIQHVLHPHPLTLEPKSRNEYGIGTCKACGLIFYGFTYKCYMWECNFGLDVRCASISEPFDYKGHKHPLFLLGLSHQGLSSKCDICKRKCHKQLNCIKCKFIMCFKCATLPYKARYKHETHFLTIQSGEEIHERIWCEVCEDSLKDTHTKVFYGCSTSFHIECLLGDVPYLKYSRYTLIYGMKIQIVDKTNLSRPICDVCKKRCQSVIRFMNDDNRIACFWRCAQKFPSYYVSDTEDTKLW